MVLVKSRLAPVNIERLIEEITAAFSLAFSPKIGWPGFVEPPDAVQGEPVRVYVPRTTPAVNRSGSGTPVRFGALEGSAIASEVLGSPGTEFWTFDPALPPDQQEAALIRTEIVTKPQGRALVVAVTGPLTATVDVLEKFNQREYRGYTYENHYPSGQIILRPTRPLLPGEDAQLDALIAAHDPTQLSANQQRQDRDAATAQQVAQVLERAAWDGLTPVQRVEALRRAILLLGRKAYHNETIESDS
jgi:hypothetical protein